MILVSPLSCRPKRALDRKPRLRRLSPRLSFVTFVLSGALVLAGAASAQSPASGVSAKPTLPGMGGPTWSGLTASQRMTLAPLERDWNGLDANRKSKWLDIASRFPKMPADEQKRVQDRMTEWARLSPAERGRARLSYQEAKQLSPLQRQERWEAYQALPDAERKALAAKAVTRAGSPAMPSASATLAVSPKQSGPAPKPANPLVQSVAPTVVQAKPGATTTLIGKGTPPPAHQRVGQPKIAAKPGQVDRATLLPKAASAAPSSPVASPVNEPQS